MIKIKVNFHLADKEFKNSVWTALDVKLGLDVNSPVNSDPEYTVMIPDHMFNELADSEPQYSTVDDINNKTRINGLFREGALTKKFKKSQTSTSISTLQNYMADLTDTLLKKHSIETATMKKKIFIKFEHNASHTTNNWTHAYRGLAISQRFNYFVGYEVMTSKFGGVSLLDDNNPRKQYVTKILYASPSSSIRKTRDTGFQEDEQVFEPLTAHGESVESFESKFLIIDHTPEREEFCKKIEQTFQDVNKKLSDFLLNLDGVKLDMLIEEGGLPLLGLPKGS